MSRLLNIVAHDFGNRIRLDVRTTDNPPVSVQVDLRTPEAATLAIAEVASVFFKPQEGLDMQHQLQTIVNLELQAAEFHALENCQEGHA